MIILRPLLINTPFCAGLPLSLRPCRSYHTSSFLPLSSDIVSMPVPPLKVCSTPQTVQTLSSKVCSSATNGVVQYWQTFTFCRSSHTLGTYHHLVTDGHRPVAGNFQRTVAEVYISKQLDINVVDLYCCTQLLIRRNISLCQCCRST